MKYLLLDGKNVNVEGCRNCPLCWYEKISETEYDLFCNYPNVTITETVHDNWNPDHYMDNCPLSPYQSLHHLWVSIQCIYQTIETLYQNFREWYNGFKK